MEIKLNYLPDKEPINKQDIDWLKYIWECSDGFDVIIQMDKIPTHLCNTVVYHYLHKRFIYYKEMEHLFTEFEYRGDENAYYIVFEQGFVSNLNGLIDKWNYTSYIGDNIQPIRQKGEVVVNKQINSRTFNGPVTNQIGTENFNSQAPASTKKEKLKIDFKGILYAFLKKIPVLKDFIKIEGG